MFTRCLFLLFLQIAWLAGGAPVLNPIGNVTVPAGKSVIIPIIATATNGRPLSYAVTGSTNAMAIVLHTNNPFWKLNVAQVCASNAPGAFQIPYRGGTATVTNVGNLLFMLFPEYAPQTVSIFRGLSAAGFYNSNTIFHRVVSNFVIQGGDPLTNGSGGLVFEYNDEFNPQAIFSGSGQLALANSGKNTDGSQFFVTVGQQRFLDFQYTLVGQLLRGFDVLSNINNTAVDANSRPLADEIITEAAFVPDKSDAVLTLTATNRTGVTNSISVIVSDGAGGLATNTFMATSVTDLSSIGQPLLYGTTVTNLAAPVNVTLTNIISGVELDGYTNYWFVLYGDSASTTNAAFSGTASNNVFKMLTYNVTNAQGQLQFSIKPTNNYTGPINLSFVVSTNSSWLTYYQYYPIFGPLPPYAQASFTFVFGDSPIVAQSTATPPQFSGVFTNLLLATFTNGVAGSDATNFSASIQWGDDSITTALITTNATKLKQVFGAHSYTNSGAYPVAITIQSRLGTTTVATNVITVVPALSLSRVGMNNVVSWPAWAYAGSLESATNLSGAPWTLVTNSAVLSGFQNVISNTVSGNQVFFRLGN